jgi:hypothetical protein
MSGSKPDSVVQSTQRSFHSFHGWCKKISLPSPTCHRSNEITASKVCCDQPPFLASCTYRHSSLAARQQEWFERDLGMKSSIRKRHMAVQQGPNQHGNNERGRLLLKVPRTAQIQVA